MDRNTELLLQKAIRAENWEDQEKASNDLQTLREEFRNRLYARGEDRTPRPSTPAASANGSAAISEPE
jgi:hypothetical protein